MRQHVVVVGIHPSCRTGLVGICPITHMMLSWPTLSRRVVHYTERPNASWYKLEIGGLTKLVLVACWDTPKVIQARGKNQKESHMM